MLKNGTNDNPWLKSEFEFVKNISGHEQHYLNLYFFVIFYAWKQLVVVYKILMYFIFIYKLVMLASLVCRPKFENLVNLILSLRICQRVYMFRLYFLLQI